MVVYAQLCSKDGILVSYRRNTGIKHRQDLVRRVEFSSSWYHFFMGTRNHSLGVTLV